MCWTAVNSSFKAMILVLLTTTAVVCVHLSIIVAQELAQVRNDHRDLQVKYEAEHKYHAYEQGNLLTG